MLVSQSHKLFHFAGFVVSDLTAVEMHTVSLQIPIANKIVSIERDVKSLVLLDPFVKEAVMIFVGEVNAASPPKNPEDEGLLAKFNAPAADIADLVGVAIAGRCKLGACASKFWNVSLFQMILGTLKLLAMNAAVSFPCSA